MARSRYLKERPLTPAEQAYFIKLRFPDFELVTVRSQLRCVGTLQPSPTSDKYFIDLQYTVPNRPHVRVLRPELKLAAGHKRLPHVFKGNDLCLYLTGEWRPHQKISEYIMPWVPFWLFFYEVWVLTGEWLGGGHETPTEK